ncbi:MAG: hypothetical protein KGH61_03845 [Candidatus Micrarchaeota archaeon]|nr:hypothetical protein [Candidatus Micrarchaeota archaeon]MDE1848054.1 hypothetical protein [Candidatus Micrarchaeota archaeon]MDE1864628.1 hypothetical protein [Candidatus Micrarchaeota archaeon]
MASAKSISISPAGSALAVEKMQKFISSSTKVDDYYHKASFGHNLSLFQLFVKDARRWSSLGKKNSKLGSGLGALGYAVEGINRTNAEIESGDLTKSHMEQLLKSYHSFYNASEEISKSILDNFSKKHGLAKSSISLEFAAVETNSKGHINGIVNSIANMANDLDGEFRLILKKSVRGMKKN